MSEGAEVEIDGQIHDETTEWVGYPIRVCGLCMQAWPCDEVQRYLERMESEQ